MERREEYLLENTLCFVRRKRGYHPFFLQQVSTIVSMDISNQSQVVRDGLAGLLRREKEKERQDGECSLFRSIAHRLFSSLFVLRACVRSCSRRPRDINGVEADRHLMRNVRYARMLLAEGLLAPSLFLSQSLFFVVVAVVCWLYCLEQEQAKDDSDCD